MKAIVIVSIFVTAVWAQEVKQGTLRGQVVDERQRAIQGAVVSISILPEKSGKTIPFRAKALTQRFGDFQIQAPPGRFMVCASLPGSNLLDSCLWEKAPLTVVMSERGASEAPTIILRKGVAVGVAVDDVQNLVEVESAKRSGKQVSMEMRLPGGMLIPMKEEGRQGVTRLYQAYVPRDVKFELLVAGNGFDVRDDKGAAIDTAKGHKVSMLVSGERTAKSLRFRVAGLKAEQGKN